MYVGKGGFNFKLTFLRHPSPKTLFIKIGFPVWSLGVNKEIRICTYSKL